MKRRRESPLRLRPARYQYCSSARCAATDRRAAHDRLPSHLRPSLCHPGPRASRPRSRPTIQLIGTLQIARPKTTRRRTRTDPLRARVSRFAPARMFARSSPPPGSQRRFSAALRAPLTSVDGTARRRRVTGVALRSRSAPRPAYRRLASPGLGFGGTTAGTESHRDRCRSTHGSSDMLHPLRSRPLHPRPLPPHDPFFAPSPYERHGPVPRTTGPSCLCSVNSSKRPPVEHNLVHARWSHSPERAPRRRCQCRARVPRNIASADATAAPNRVIPAYEKKRARILWRVTALDFRVRATYANNRVLSS